MNKPYSQMTPAERLADRISKNRQMEAKIEESKPVSIPARVSVPRWFTPAIAAQADAIVASGAIVVKCWNRNIIIANSHAEAIRAEIQRRLAVWVAAGSNRTCQRRAGWSTVSVQTAINAVRDTLRINFPTNHGEAQEVLEALGFQLERLSDGHTTIITGVK